MLYGKRTLQSSRESEDEATKNNLNFAMYVPTARASTFACHVCKVVSTIS